MKREYIIILVVCFIWSILGEFTITPAKRALEKKGKSRYIIMAVELLISLALFIILYTIAAWLGFDIAD